SERIAGNVEEADRLFARSAAIPGGEALIQQMIRAPSNEGFLKSPRERLSERLGDADAVADRLTESYRDLAVSLADEERSADDSDRLVLAELYTGAQCGPCIAADMATTALAQAFPAEDLLVLQYHVHIPGPDPLANGDTVARSAATDVQGTPTLRLDGKDLETSVGGPATSAGDVFDRLVEAVEERRSVAAGAEIELTAGANGGRFSLAVTAARDGGFESDHRLHVAVAEDEATYAAPNAIRVHEMLVRAMPTGAAGVRAGEDGTLAFKYESAVVDLRDELAAYLLAYERDRDNRRFPEKPMELTKLSAVAWVQDKTTGEVLQAAVAPIGEFAPPAEEPTESEEKPSDATEEPGPTDGGSAEGAKPANAAPTDAPTDEKPDDGADDPKSEEPSEPEAGEPGSEKPEPREDEPQP
ncbi:MAG: hypothetical protein AAF907_10380, partial [Planctomycetota bacterium]